MAVTDDKNLTTIRNILMFFASIVMMYLLYLLKDILIPLFLAMFLALLFQPILAAFERRKVPMIAGVSIIWLIFIIAMAGIGTIIYKTGMDLYQEKAVFIANAKDKLIDFIDLYKRFTNRELDFEATVDNIGDFLRSQLTMENSTSYLGAIGMLLEEFLLTAVFLAIFLSGIMRYENYLHYLGGNDGGGKFIHAFEQVKNAIVQYVKVKIVISTLYGIGVAIICKLFGLQVAFFWGFIGLVLNFLPVIGAIIGLVPVFLMAMIQYDSMATPWILIFMCYAYHFILASLIEPFFMGAKTSLNVIAVIVGLLFWGFIWGIYGVFLSVPLMVLTKVILSQIEGAEVIVRLLGSQKDVK